MVILHSYVNVYQRVSAQAKIGFLQRLPHPFGNQCNLRAELPQPLQIAKKTEQMGDSWGDDQQRARGSAGLH